MKESFLRHREKTPAVPVVPPRPWQLLGQLGAAGPGSATAGISRSSGAAAAPGRSVPVTAATERSPSGHRAVTGHCSGSSCPAGTPSQHPGRVTSAG